MAEDRMLTVDIAELIKAAAARPIRLLDGGDMAGLTDKLESRLAFALDVPKTDGLVARVEEIIRETINESVGLADEREEERR